VLAAHRGGIKKVLIPKENAKDVREIPKKVREVLEIVCVEHADEVLREALIPERPEEFLKKPGTPAPTPSSEAAAQA
jgi:ATP-dependent Lon protease